MIITLTPAGGLPVTVGDDSAGEYISGLGIAQTVLVDDLARIRASHVSPVTRYNATNAVSWQVEYVHASEEAANEFRAAHPDSVPNEGQLTIYDNQGNPLKRFLAAAKRSVSPASVDTGATTRFAYEFICGASDTISVALDENNAVLTDESGAAILT